MRYLGSILIGLTFGFAVASVYLGARLVAEQEHAVDAAQQRARVEVRIQDLARTAPAAAVDVVTSPTPAAATPPPTVEEPQPTTFEIPIEVQLKRLTEPQRRSRSLLLQREAEREAHPGLVAELRLSAEEADALFTILGEQSLRYQERRLRNEATSRNEFMDDSVLEATAREELTALLGPQGLRAVLRYRDGIPERRRMGMLADRLGSADAFTRDQAQQLTEAMRLERSAFEAEVGKLAGEVRFETGYPEDARLRNAKRPARLQFADDHRARVEAFYERIRNRASAFLSPQQFERLRQMQDERVASTRADILWARYVAPAQEALKEAEAAERNR